MHMHPVVSVIHLEPCDEDASNRRLPTKLDTVIVDGTKQYEIERILQQEADKCLVKWKGLQEQTWEPVANLRKDAPDVLHAFQLGKQNQHTEQRA